MNRPGPKTPAAIEMTTKADAPVSREFTLAMEYVAAGFSRDEVSANLIGDGVDEALASRMAERAFAAKSVVMRQSAKAHIVVGAVVSLVGIALSVASYALKPAMASGVVFGGLIALGAFEVVRGYYLRAKA